MGKGIRVLAVEALERLDSAKPWELHFVDLNRPKAEVEAELRARFQNWERTWVRPYLEEIRDKATRR